MCGIVGAISQQNVAMMLLEGLKRLEYRGYDSAGIATIDANQRLCRYRVTGKIKELETLLISKPLPGNIGIAHTRWATHGKPTENNAHPHIVNNEIAIVHNGIIENYEAIRTKLVKAGCVFTSETDSELIAHLVYLHTQSGKNLLNAAQAAAKELEGAFAIGLLRKSEPNHLIALRYGSPLVIGLGIQENFIASDQTALLPFTQQFIYLEEGDIADIQLDKVIIFDANNREVERSIHSSQANSEIMNKGKYKHFIQKEIFEQPDAILSTLEGRITRQRVIKKRKISVLGLGYVGLTTASAFGQLGEVVAFDTDKLRIAELKKGYDRNEEVPIQDLKAASIHYTTNPNDLKEADFHIISVPTPLDETKQPNLSMLIKATETIGKQLKKGDIVVFESTVYPGATEEKCIPILEKMSGLHYKKDFFAAYSPERINPADRQHNFYNVIKIISATDDKTLNIVAETYKSIISAGVYPVSSIRVAEAIKVIENIQRDINISFMNEAAIILHALDIDTSEVIAGMQTKWNFIPFKPGLVGGHCIGVNSYYLMHKASEVGSPADIIASARRINEFIIKYITEQTTKQMLKLGIRINQARIAILGLTYKENCPDVRDTRVIDIIRELETHHGKIIVHDPIANPVVAREEYNINLTSWDEMNHIDVMIITVAHQQYIDLDKSILKNKLNRPGLIIDIKDILKPEDFNDTGITLWRL